MRRRMPASPPLEVQWSDGNGTRARLRSRSLQTRGHAGRADRPAGAARRRARPPRARELKRMGTSATLEFEKPIVELEKQIDELKRLAGEPAARRRRRDRAAREEARRAARGDLQESHAAGSACRWRAAPSVRSRSTTSSSLHRLHRAARRPRLPRRRRDRRRLGASRRRDGDGHRPPARPRHEGDSQAQLRHAASRRAIARRSA